MLLAAAQPTLLHDGPGCAVKQPELSTFVVADVEVSLKVKKKCEWGSTAHKVERSIERERERAPQSLWQLLPFEVCGLRFEVTVTTPPRKAAGAVRKVA